jgi:hypothetical protein
VIASVNAICLARHFIGRSRNPSEQSCRGLQPKALINGHKWLRVIINADDEAKAKTNALAEHVARHPEDVGRG